VGFVNFKKAIQVKTFEITIEIAHFLSAPFFLNQFTPFFYPPFIHPIPFLIPIFFLYSSNLKNHETTLADVNSNEAYYSVAHSPHAYNYQNDLYPTDP